MELTELGSMSKPISRASLWAGDRAARTSRRRRVKDATGR